MSISIKTVSEQEKMRKAGHAAASVLDFIESYVKAGISTEELNTLCHNYIIQNKWIPAPLNYHGFPKSICTSLNNVICHGIPKKEDVLKDGDIINIDITVIKDGYHGDTSRMFFVGTVNENAQKLVERTYNAMMIGIDAVKPGKPFSDIGTKIENYLSQFPYAIVKEFVGHGIGKGFHEDPHVMHYKTNEKGPLMKEGMTFTVEPMVNEGLNWQTKIDSKDKWTVRTIDGALSAQWEHTILVTKTGYEILTESRK